MSRTIAKLLIVTLAFLAASYLIPGIEVASFYTALIIAVLWGLINLILRPFLIFVTLPINFLTIGLFTFVINGFLFWFLGTFIKGFEVAGFLVAIIGALVVSVITSIGNSLIDNK